MITVKLFEITLVDAEDTWHSWRQECKDFQEAAESGMQSAKHRNMRLHNVTRVPAQRFVEPPTVTIE